MATKKSSPLQLLIHRSCSEADTCYALFFSQSLHPRYFEFAVRQQGEGKMKLLGSVASLHD